MQKYIIKAKEMNNINERRDIHFVRLAIILTAIILSSSQGFAAAANNIKGKKMASLDALTKEQVIPDVIDHQPAAEIKIDYPSGVKVEQGKELTPTQVKDVPRVEFQADPSKFYTLVMVDPDAPSRAEPSLREILHYMVSNIPGNDVARGDVLAEYIGSGPPPKTGLHRYIFLVYEQKSGKVTSNMKILKTSRMGRPNFSIRNFAKTNNFGEPVAANFYQAQYDDYVPKLHAQLSSG